MNDDRRGKLAPKSSSYTVPATGLEREAIELAGCTRVLSTSC